jgi:ArsR family transcriptional regulator
MKPIERKYQRRAEIFKALSNPLRLVMLERLEERPWCVCALAAELDVDKSIVSKYLNQLKSVGLIEDTKKGTLVEYRLVAPCILRLASCAEETIQEQRKKLLNEI